MGQHVLLGRCTECEKFTYSDDFTDGLSLKNFADTGMCINCQIKKGVLKYTVQYFISKFEEIAEQSWVASTYKDKDAYCALGHCGELASNELTRESSALESLFDKNHLRVSLVNDGKCPKYPQGSPKQRVLAALYDIRECEGQN